MKKVILFILVIFSSSCNCKKSTLQKNNKVSLENNCPKDGTCSVEIFDNKGLTVKQDEFGSVYYNLDDNLNTKVVKYIYTRTVNGNLQDAGYREEIVFELNNDIKKLSLSNHEIQNTKMLFGRFCYCKGQTGNYKITTGNLETTDKTIKLQFTITQVPQIIKNIAINLY